MSGKGFWREFRAAVNPISGMWEDAQDEWKAENARLRAALLKIQQWDCLNPPDPTLCADHPWLKRLVDDALAEHKSD